MAVYAKRATMWADEMIALTGTAIVVTLDTTQPYAFYSRQTTPANADSFTQSFVMAAGTYTFTAYGETAADNGIIDWYLNGTIIAAGTGQDWYSAGTTVKVSKTFSMVLAADGYQLLKGVINGKNASSSNYAYRLTKFWLTPSAD